MDTTTSRAPGASHRTEAFVCFRPEGSKDLRRLPVPDPALAAAAAAASKANEFRGEKGETLLLHGGRAGRRLLLAGLGEAAQVTPETLRQASAAAALALDARAIRRATFLLPPQGDREEMAVAAVEGAGLALYRFDQLKSKRRPARLAHVTVAPEAGGAGDLAAAVRRASIVTEAVCFTRDLGNLPPNVATPEYLARRARELSGRGVTVRVHDRAAIRRLRMGAFAAVAQGSQTEPRLIEILYRGGGARAPRVALVGKGVTFDTGGISIKPSQNMEEMKFDMCGAGAVLGCMRALKALRPRVNVHALLPAADNMPSGRAYRPGDILRARNGTTIEVISTDAEGRLLLCDALAYAAERKPDCIVDLATLTGACVVALGDAAAGLFGSDEKLVAQVEAAAQAAGEPAWPMPLYPRYDQLIQSAYADLKNVGGRNGGACTAAAFLKRFVGDVPWAHLDIAGTAWGDKEDGYKRRGATGYGVRLLIRFLLQRSGS
ncbi:MAG: leucyl aminopeptidase [Planctomycetota bacterium]